MTDTLTEITHPNRPVEVKLDDAAEWVRGTEITVEHWERPRGPYEPTRFTRHFVLIGGFEYSLGPDAIRAV